MLLICDLLPNLCENIVAMKRDLASDSDRVGRVADEIDRVRKKLLGREKKSFPLAARPIRSQKVHDSTQMLEQGFVAISAEGRTEAPESLLDGGNRALCMIGFNGSGPFRASLQSFARNADETVALIRLRGRIATKPQHFSTLGIVGGQSKTRCLPNRLSMFDADDLGHDIAHLCSLLSLAFCISALFLGIQALLLKPTHLRRRLCPCIGPVGWLRHATFRELQVGFEFCFLLDGTKGCQLRRQPQVEVTL